jgi:hypothetical protein
MVPERYRNTVEDMTEEEFWEKGGYEYIATLCGRGKGRDALRHHKATAKPFINTGASRIAAQISHSRHRKSQISKKVGRVLRGKW